MDAVFDRIVHDYRFHPGNILDVYSAWRRGSRLADALSVAFTFMPSMPYFWAGLALLYVLGFVLSWFPISHAYSQNIQLGWNFQPLGCVLYHAILPAFSIVTTSIGRWVLDMRNNLIGILSDDYVTLAHNAFVDVGNPRRRRL